MPHTVFILERTPGAAEADTVPWTRICHRNPKTETYVLVHHVPSRWLSRWRTEARKRPFAVGYNGVGEFQTFSYHVTLKAALKAAKKLASEERS